MSEPFKGRQARQECWNAKDKYWACLDEAEKSSSDPETIKTKCAHLREPYVTGCGNKWTEHFDRRREYLKFKKRLEEEGAKAIDERKLKQ